MSDLKAKMHQIRFRLGDPLVGFGGPKEREREGRAGEGRGKEEGEGREGKRGKGRGGKGA